ncbi:MAG: hypothetical protein LBH09_00195, partial [Peptococcaceae bacterium]|nr:hypothetical protein [Peptococcaceae bacterium]
LRDGASDLSKLNLRPDAPPAFLLDAGRMANGVENVAGKFDNRWCIFPQDMPSASYLISKGIRKIIVHMQTKSDDLVHILYRYQKLGIEIYLNTGNESKITEVKKPSALKSLFYRFSVIIKLKRNMAGGFGGAVLDFEETRYGHG